RESVNRPRPAVGAQLKTCTLLRLTLCGVVTPCAVAAMSVFYPKSVTFTRRTAHSNRYAPPPMAVDIDTTVAAPVDPSAEEHMVPARDGVELATDVYLADGDGPRPAVLVRLPYDKNGRYCWMPFIARYFTGRGYAFVVQDVRGKFRSGGET